MRPADGAPFPHVGDDDAAVADVARAYLHVNCSTCHRPGEGRFEMDFRATTPLAGTGACDVEPSAGSFGVDDARVIAPGDAARSMVAVRMRTTGAGRMPQIGSHYVDEVGAAAVAAYIDALDGCD